MADVLVVAVFDDEPTAWDAVVTASTIAAQGQLGLHDACLVVREPDGKVHLRETHDISTSKSGWYGGAWGLLGGAILGFPIAVAAAGAGFGIFAAVFTQILQVTALVEDFANRDGYRFLASDVRQPDDQIAKRDQGCRRAAGE
jgi:uncharacterized membrane protein